MAAPWKLRTVNRILRTWSGERDPSFGTALFPTFRYFLSATAGIPSHSCKMRLFLVPLTPLAWTEYCGWFKARGKEPPAPVNEGVWVADESGRLIGGVCIYRTDGPYALAEHFSANPAAPGRLRAHALRIVCQALQHYAATSSKHLIVAPNFQSGYKALLRAGFMESEAVLMVSRPGVCVADVPERKVKRDTVPGMKLPTERPKTSYSIQEPPPDEPLPVAPKRRRK